ncbi:hypothetical protein MRX96_027561 [Rhipicephalus microplus]
MLDFSNTMQCSGISLLLFTWRDDRLVQRYSGLYSEAQAPLLCHLHWWCLLFALVSIAHRFLQRTHNRRARVDPAARSLRWHVASYGSCVNMSTGFVRLQ